MKSPSKNVSASLRAQGTKPISGPGPIERGRVKQGMSAGVWPGERTAGQAPPGSVPDNCARSFANAIKSTGGY